MKRMFLLMTTPVLGVLVACGGSDPSITSVTVSPATVAPGGELTVAVAVADFELKNPDDVAAHGLRAADGDNEHEEASGDYPNEGHFHVYMDAFEMVNPLMLNCPEHCKHPGFSESVRAKIPDDATPGMHEIIVLLNDNSHKTLVPHIMGSADFMVE